MFPLAALMAFAGAGAEGFMKGEDMAQRRRESEQMQRLNQMRIMALERAQRPVSSLYPGLAEAAISDRPTLAKARPNIGDATMGDLQDILGLFDTQDKLNQRHLQGERANTSAMNAEIAAFREIRLTYSNPLDAARQQFRLAERRLMELEADIAQGNVFPDEAEPIKRFLQMKLMEAQEQLSMREGAFETGVVPGAETLRNRHGLGGKPTPRKVAPSQQVDTDEYIP